MKPSRLYHQYLWLINAFMRHGRLTLEALSREWVADEVADGKALSRTTFNRHRDAILDMFGIIIDCDKTTYQYYIGNPDILDDDTIGRWLLSTLTVHGVLADSTAVKDRVVLEDVPAGLEYLASIISAIKASRRIRLGYRKFGTEGYQKTVCPYALKLFHQRWYLLARTADDQMRIYAFDRMTAAEPTDEPFEMPGDFSPQAYFAEYFGVLTDQTPLEHVVVRAYRRTPDYLRTLPLHHSQRELTAGGDGSDDGQPQPSADYADFAYDIRPTADFIGQLLSHGDGIEVLAPASLRERVRQQVEAMLSRY